jgi:multiple sugar transport system permease protein
MPGTRGALVAEEPRLADSQAAPGAGSSRRRLLGASPGRVGQLPPGRGAFPYVAVLPAALLVAALMLFPIGDTVYHSFTAWSGGGSTFVGLTNFRLLAENGVLRTALMNSVIFLISVPLILLSSVVAAVLVYERVLGWRVFRFLFFIPGVLSSVIVGELFSTFFLPNGLANAPLRALGLQSIQWLTEPWPARIVIILALVWSSFGFGMVVVLSAMSGIDPSLYDAASIDGATWWTRLRRITIPLISESIQFLSVINVIFTFTSLFGFVYVITAGGPGFSTTTVDYYTYITTFENGDFGYGAALAVIIFVIVLLLTIAQLVMFPPRPSQQGS